MSSWHEEMADAVRLRQKALNGVARWQEKLAEAEAVIEQLSTERQNVVEKADSLPSPEEPQQIRSTLMPVFGVTETA